MRIPFLDYVRLIACLMVIFVHACEFYYIGADGMQIASASDGMWVTLIDSMLRCCVPLFVMVSGFLLLPVKQPSSLFFKKRLVRVILPFIFWVVMYAVLPALWSEHDATASLARLITNFSDNAGHLWFVYMLVGVYLIMPVISPWLERCNRGEERAYLLIWFFTMFFPYIRHFAGYIYGEGAWNEFNLLYYFSGFLGYAVLGHYLRKYYIENPAGQLSRGRVLAVSVPLILIGYAVTAIVFHCMIPATTDLEELELSWRFCTPNVAVVALGFFLLCSLLKRERPWVISMSNLSYGVYLMHIFVLNVAYMLISPHFSTPVSICLIAISTYAVCFIICKLISLLPGSKYIIG